MNIILGSRGSDLALWQANEISHKLENLGHKVVIKIIKTKGDRIQNLSFDKIEGKGFFTKEIEECLLNREIDLAVHSHKDLETNSPKKLLIGAVSEREDPSDILLINKKYVDKTKTFFLKDNCVVGTSSARRKTQLFDVRKDIKIKDIRGNIPTRINKLKDDKFNAIIIAYAGVKRLGLNVNNFEILHLSPKEFVPAPAQGVLALQIRQNDENLYKAILPLNNKKVEDCVKVERGILNKFMGGCQMPIGVYCEKKDNLFHVWTIKSTAWDKTVCRDYFVSNNINEIINGVKNRLKKKI